MNYHFSSVTSTSLNRYLFYRSSTNTVLYWSSSQFHIRLKFTTRSNCTTTITTTTTTALLSRHFIPHFQFFNDQCQLQTTNCPKKFHHHHHHLAKILIVMYIVIVMIQNIHIRIRIQEQVCFIITNIQCMNQMNF